MAKTGTARSLETPAGKALGEALVSQIDYQRQVIELHRQESRLAHEVSVARAQGVSPEDIADALRLPLSRVHALIELNIADLYGHNAGEVCWWA